MLPPEKAKTFTAYDLRHARITQWAETGNLTGTAFMAGHRRISTTDRYAHRSRGAAERLLASTGETNLEAAPLAPPHYPLKFRNLEERLSAKERTRTSTGVTPLPPQRVASTQDHRGISGLEGNKKEQEAPVRMPTGGGPPAPQADHLSPPAQAHAFLDAARRPASC